MIPGQAGIVVGQRISPLSSEAPRIHSSARGRKERDGLAAALWCERTAGWRDPLQQREFEIGHISPPESLVGGELAPQITWSKRSGTRRTWPESSSHT